MIAAWMLHAAALSALLGLSAAAAERAARLLGRPGRWTWAAAVAVSLGGVAVAALAPGGDSAAGPVGSRWPLGGAAASLRRASAAWDAPLLALWAAGAVALAAALAAGGPHHAAHAQAARDSAGVRVVESARPAWAAGRGWRVAGEPSVDVDLGLADRRKWGTATMGVVRLSDGRVVVADMERSQLRFFDPAGRPLAAVGGSGTRPGEFGQLMAVRRLAGDTLVARGHRVDGRGVSGFELVTAAGEHVRTVPSPPFAPGRPVVSLIGVLADGSVLGGTNPQGGGGLKGIRVDSATLLRFSATGAFLDSVLRVPAVVYAPDSAGRALHVTFAPRYGAAVDGSGFYFGFPDRYEIRYHSADGRLRRVIRRSWTPRPVTDADVRAYREHFTTGGAGGGRMENGSQFTPAFRAFRERLARQLTFARTFPAYRGMLVDAAGHLWVKEFDPWDEYAHGRFHESPPGPTRWSVFSPEGRWLGDVRLPAGFVVMDIGADHVAGLFRDAAGREHARVHRLEKP